MLRKYWRAIRDSMMFEAKVIIAEERILLLRERVADLERHRNGLVVENDALMAKLQEADQYIEALRRSAPGSNMSFTAMPSQAKDWKNIAAAMEARAQLNSYQQG